MKLSSRIKRIPESLTLTITAKAKEMISNGLDVIAFGSGEPDFDTPLFIKDAGIKAIQEGFTKYTAESGIEPLKKAICEKFKSDNHLIYDPSQVVVSCGAKHSIYNVIQVICEKGDEVLIPSPYWLSYPEMVKLAEATPRFIETDEGTNFKILANNLKKKINRRTRLLIINSPSNPTGSVYRQEELREIAEVSLKYGIAIISDEVYEKIIFDGIKHISIASLGKQIFNNTIVVNGVSKTYAMTGWRIGYLASPDKKLISAIKNLQAHSTSNPTSISQIAALEALKSRDSFLREMVDEFKNRRDYIVKRVNAIKGLSCNLPEGAFYVFCRIERKGLSSMELANRLLTEAQVAVVPGKVFGSDRHIRLSFATTMEQIRKGMDRIEKWFQEN